MGKKISSVSTDIRYRSVLFALQILGVNVTASFLLTKLVVPHMEKRG